MRAAIFGCAGVACFLPIVGRSEGPVGVEVPSVKSEARGIPPVVPLRLYSGQVISSTEAGAIVECKVTQSAGQIKGANNSNLTGRFYLRGIPELLVPSAEIQFLATDDGAYRYVDFFKTVSTMRALRFVKWEKPAVAATPTSKPIAAQPAPTPTPKPRSTNPTPNLRGTMLDRPPERLPR